MGFGFGFRFGLGAAAGYGAPSPTVDTLELPAVSDEHVQLTTLVCSDGTDYVALVEGAGTPAPAYPGDGWTDYDPDNPPSIDVTGSGSVTIKVFPHSAGGVGEAESGTVDVYPGLVAFIDPALDFTLVDVHVEELISTFTPAGVAIQSNTTDVLDPVGGNAASRLTEDTNTSPHFTYKVQSGLVVQGPLQISTYAKAGTGVYGFYAKAGQANRYYVSDISSGADILVGSELYNADTALVSAGWYVVRFDTDSSGGYVEIGLSDATGANALSYLGTGLTAYFYHPTQHQHRCSAVLDQVGDVEFLNSSGATQPFARVDATSPGWPGVDGAEDLWAPLNNAPKSLATDDPILCALLEAGTAWTILARVRKVTNPSSAAPLLNATGTGDMAVGIGTDGKPYLAATSSSTLTHASALDTASHGVAWSTSAAGAASIYLDETKTTGTITPGSIEADTLTLGMRGFALGKLAICAGQMSDAQVASCLGAMS
jgi:hypothetical protein